MRSVKHCDYHQIDGTELVDRLAEQICFIPPVAMLLRLAGHLSRPLVTCLLHCMQTLQGTFSHRVAMTHDLSTGVSRQFRLAIAPFHTQIAFVRTRVLVIVLNVMSVGVVSANALCEAQFSVSQTASAVMVQWFVYSVY